MKDYKIISLGTIVRLDQGSKKTDVSEVVAVLFTKGEGYYMLTGTGGLVSLFPADVVEGMERRR